VGVPHDPVHAGHVVMLGAANALRRCAFLKIRTRGCFVLLLSQFVGMTESTKRGPLRIARNENYVKLLKSSDRISSL
jgi:hypothetical protein